MKKNKNRFAFLWYVRKVFHAHFGISSGSPLVLGKEARTYTTGLSEAKVVYHT
jgi:hypothetical protein